MAIAHDPWLVALSVVVAIQGTYVALGLTARINQQTGWARRLTLGGAALTLATAIWSMHFVGMLALRPPMRLEFLMLPTLLSLLVCMVVVGAAVFVGCLMPVRRWAWTLAAAIMGTGIATMHYVGMLALHGSAMLHHDWRFVVASFAVAIGASAPGLRFAFQPRPARQRGLAAILLGLAISGMHYVAMAGMTLDTPVPGAAARSVTGVALSSDVLAMVVALVAFAVSAVFLLTLVPERAPAATAALAPAPRPPRVAVGSPATGPLGDIGAPKLRQLASTLPVEREGATRQIAVESIVFVQADTHYSTVFDGCARLFCPLPIGDVEQLLDGARFLRVHRSYLVAVDRIAQLQRAGDGGSARFDTPVPVSVPVSRARYTALKARLAGRVLPEMRQVS